MYVSVNRTPNRLERFVDKMPIRAVALTKNNVPRQLSLISPELTTVNTKVGNQGTSTKTPDIAPCSNLYESAPSSQSGRAVLSSSRNKPRDIRMTEDGFESIQVGFLERHPYTSQSFIPMGGSGRPAYVVIVADDQPDGMPDLESVRAFLVRGDQGVCYAAGAWHAPMATIRNVRVSWNDRLSELIKQTLDFGIFQYMNGVASEDCEMFELQLPLTIII